MERLGQWATNYRRLRKLRGTVSEKLQTGHIDSLELLELLRSLNIKVIYDVGANIGTWTLLARSIIPEAEVHAFEPLKAHCCKFLELTRDLSGITLHTVALGNRIAFMDMKVTDFTDASSLLDLTDSAREVFNLRSEGTEQVEVVRLDNYVKEAGLHPPDLIKLDIQGYEVEALLGGEQTVANTSAIIAEVSCIEFYAGQGLFHDVVALLAEKGLFLCAFGLNTSLGKTLSQMDVLFVRNTSTPND